MESAVLYPYNPPENAAGLSEIGSASRRCPFPCCFTCLHAQPSKLTGEQRDRGMRLAFRTLSDEAGCPEEQQEEWLLGIREAVASIATHQRRALEGDASAAGNAAASVGLVLMWLRCGMLAGLMRLVVASWRGYIVYLALDVLCTLASARGELLGHMLQEGNRLAEMLVRVSVLDGEHVPEGIQGAIGVGGAVMAMSATQLFACKERALTCLPFLLSCDYESALRSKAVMEVLLPYLRGVQPSDVLEDWSSPDGEFQQALLLPHGEEAPKVGTGELHEKLRPYADRYSAILQERAAVAMEAACLAVCDDEVKTRKWLEVSGGSALIDLLWSIAEKKPSRCFGESYARTAVMVVLDCLACAGPATSAMRLTGTPGLVEEVVKGHWDQLWSVLDIGAVEIDLQFTEEFGNDLRANPCRHSPLSSEGLARIRQDLVAKVSHAVNILAVVVSCPGIAAALDGARFKKLAKAVLAAASIHRQATDKMLKACQVAGRAAPDLLHFSYEDGGDHVLGRRELDGSVTCTHWTQPLFVSAAFVMAHFRATCAAEDLRDMGKEVDAFVMTFAGSRMAQCDFRARALLEVGVGDETVDEWVELCIESPSDSANRDNAALYWAICGQVCSRALHVLMASGRGGAAAADLSTLAVSEQYLRMEEALAWYCPPRGRAPSLRELECCRAAVPFGLSEDAAKTLVAATRKAAALRCGACGVDRAAVEKLQACGGCKAAYYCSKACQTADWKLHKRACR